MLVEHNCESNWIEFKALVEEEFDQVRAGQTLLSWGRDKQVERNEQKILVIIEEIFEP